MWKVRDQLKAQLSMAELRQLLEANSQAIPSGESRVSMHIHARIYIHVPLCPVLQLLDCCADGMVFGALQPCPECKGQLVCGNYSYHCTGNISSWTKCVYSSTEPERKPWTVPAELREEFEWL